MSRDFFVGFSLSPEQKEKLLPKYPTPRGVEFFHTELFDKDLYPITRNGREAGMIDNAHNQSTLYPAWRFRFHALRKDFYDDDLKRLAAFAKKFIMRWEALNLRLPY